MKEQTPFFKNLGLMLQARYPVIYLETSEFERVYQKLKGIAAEENYQLLGWNFVDGLRKFDIRSDKETPTGECAREAESILSYIRGTMKEDSNQLFVLEGFHEFIDTTEVKTWLRKFSEDLKFCKGKKHILLLSPVMKLPKELEKHIVVLDVPLPSRSDLAAILRQVQSASKHQPDEETFEQLISAALGMTESEADLAFCLAWSKTKFGKGAAEVVIREKEQIVKKSGILEYYPQSEKLSDVGGLENLKHWLRKRGAAFSPAARAFHLSEPKGILLLGVPGCGKSLTAKAIASMWNMPLLRLDLGKVFEGVVGSSEGNIRQAIKTAEAVSPCILWIDEIEKGLSGTSSSGSTDGGVTARVFSTLLTWMQEKQSPVFTVATANGIEHLPPELLRKGRFDGIFFVDLPATEERKHIFSIHLQRRGQKPADFSPDLLSDKTTGFNGAEIAEVVNDALFTAFSENPAAPKLQMKHLIDAIQTTVILASTMKERIEYLRKWAATRAVPAGIENREEIPQRETVLAPEEKRRNRQLDN